MDDEPWMMHDTSIINDDEPVCGPHPPILGTQLWNRTPRGTRGGAFTGYRPYAAEVTLRCKFREIIPNMGL